MRDPALRSSDFRLVNVMGIKGMEVDNSEKERAKEKNSRVKKKNSGKGEKFRYLIKSD